MNEKPFVDQKGRTYRYGDFLPTELSPFAYNDTLSCEIFALTEKECLSLGFAWRPPPIERASKTTITRASIPDVLPDDSAYLLREIIECTRPDETYALCPGAFRLTQKELAFYSLHKLQLPDTCPACRHKLRMQSRRPPILYHGKCGAMDEKSSRYSRNFLTAYRQTDDFKILCESCFQEAVL